MVGEGITRRSRYELEGEEPYNMKFVVEGNSKDSGKIINLNLTAEVLRKLAAESLSLLEDDTVIDELRVDGENHIKLEEKQSGFFLKRRNEKGPNVKKLNNK